MALYRAVVNVRKRKRRMRSERAAAGGMFPALESAGGAGALDGPLEPLGNRGDLRLVAGPQLPVDDQAVAEPARDDVDVEVEDGLRRAGAVRLMQIDAVGAQLLLDGRGDTLHDRHDRPEILVGHGQQVR